MPRKILIIEDAELLLEGYHAYLDAHLQVLTATTLLDALDVFEANTDVELIAVDGLFPRAAGESDVPEQGMRSSGERFIVNIRYAGPIIACSSEDSLNQRMRATGATHVSMKGRPLLKLICELLVIPSVVQD
jgi:DNA-binding response OmpR family regulator